MTVQAYSRDDIKRLLNCSDTTFYNLLKSGRLTARKVLGSTVVMSDEYERFLSALPVAEMGKSPLKGKPRNRRPPSAPAAKSRRAGAAV